MKKKVKSYGFWISVAGGIGLAVELVLSMFNLKIAEGKISQIIISVCGVLVVAGILVKPQEGEEAETTDAVSQINTELKADEHKDK